MIKLFKTEVPRSFIAWLVPAIFGLLIFCIVTVFQLHEKIESSGREALAQGDKESEQVEKLWKFVEDVYPVMQRSLDRTMQLRKIAGYGRKDTIDAQTNNSWHKLSAEARLDAAKDLSILDRYSEDTCPLSTPVKEGLGNLLKSELKLWDMSEQYIDAKSAVPKDDSSEEKSFQEFTRSFIDHMRSVGSVQSLHMQAADRILVSKGNSKSRHEGFINDLDQARMKIKIALVGAVLAALSIAVLFVFYIYLSHKGESRGSGTKKRKKNGQ